MNFSTIEITNLDLYIENCKVFHYRNEDNFRINVFFLEASSDIISECWKRFSNIVAANFQNSDYMSDREFDKWNFYIIYISKDAISKDLKNKIENDKFSSRKIVEDLYDMVFNDVRANKLIIKHITNSDLKEIVDSTEEVSVSRYTPKNEKLWKLLLAEEKLIRDRKAQEVIVNKINSL